MVDLNISLDPGVPADGFAQPDAPAPAAVPALVAELPDGASVQPDGSVLLHLAYPVQLAFRAAGDAGAKAEAIDRLSFRRLTGADVGKITAAADARATMVALGCALGWTPARVALLMERIDAADMTAAAAVIAALLEPGDGLPERAREEDGKVVLPLLVPVGGVNEITFRRITGADLQAIARAKDMLPTALARASRIPLPEARTLFDEMDGADAIGVSRVVGFLSGTGRTTGR